MDEIKNTAVKKRKKKRAPMWVLFFNFRSPPAQSPLRLRRFPPLCKGGKDDVTRSASLVKGGGNAVRH